MKKILLLSLVIIVNAIQCLGQQDTLFWFSPPKIPNSITTTETRLAVKAFNQSATVTVSLPANNSFTPQTITIPANSIQEFDFSTLFTTLYPSASGIQNNGVKISSNQPISTEWIINNTTYKEDFILKGQMALGSDFYVPMQKHWSVSSTGNAGFTIVASVDNTTVLITPKTAASTSTSSSVSATFSVLLQKGQTFFVNKSNLGDATSLAGSIVSSNQPVAVTVYEHGTGTSSCHDLIGDQLISSNFLGTTFVLPKTSTEDRVFVMAVENGTQISMGGGAVTANLSWGETAILTPTADFSYLQSNKKVYVYHVAARDCEFSASLVPNATCAGSYTANLVRKNSNNFSIFLYTRTGFENNFTINNAPIDLSTVTFQPVLGATNGLVAAEIPLNDIPVGGLVQVVNTVDIFGAASYNGAASNGSYFSFASDYSVTTFSNAGVDATTCANVPLALNGLVGGGAISGSWSTTGYGSFANANNQLVNNYQPSPLDVLISPIKLILTSTGECPIKRDTLMLTVNPLPIVSASVDQIICSNNSLVNLNGNVQGGSTTGLWSTNGTGTFIPDAETLNAQYLPSPLDIQTGSLQLNLISTNNGNCMAESDQMSITFTSPAVVSIAEDSLIICHNNSVVELEGSVSGSSSTGKWVSQGVGMFFPNNIALATSYQPGANDLANSNLWIYLESTNNGQCIPVKDSIKIIFTPSPVVDAGLNRLICINQDTIHLSGVANGVFGGQWTGGQGTFDDAGSLMTFYTPTQAEIDDGSLTLTLTSDNNGNCISNADIVQFSFVDVPFVNFLISDGCLGSAQEFTNYSLAGSGSVVSSSWDFGDGNTGNNLNESHVYDAPGTYTVSLSVVNSNGCVSTDTREAIVHDKPSADFNFASNCDFQTLTVSFTDAATATDGIASYLYDLGGQENIQNADFSFDFKQIGTYYISQIVTSVNGCSDTITKTLTIEPFPIAGFGYNYTSGMNVGTTFNFIDTSQHASTYSWQLGNLETSVEQDPTVVYYENGYYNIIQWVYNANGCYDSTSTWIQINNITSNIETLIPNVISPNGDGYNDVWKLSFINILYPNAEVNIFNQWGQLLFESVGYETPWDGRYAGEDVPDGNYYYVINLNNGKEDAIYKGALLVLRSTK